MQPIQIFSKQWSALNRKFSIRYYANGNSAEIIDLKICVYVESEHAGSLPTGHRQGIRKVAFVFDRVFKLEFLTPQTGPFPEIQCIRALRKKGEKQGRTIPSQLLQTFGRDDGQINSKMASFELFDGRRQIESACCDRLNFWKSR
jgi:hypothetical protein